MDVTDPGTQLASPVRQVATPPVTAAPTTALPTTASPTTASPTTGRDRAPRLRAFRRPVLQGLLAFAIYEAVFVIGFARPLLGHLNVPQVREDWTDPNFYTWAMQWWPYAVTHGLNPLYSTEIGAPNGYSLAWATTTPSVSLLMWPVTAVFGVIASYNVMLLTVPPVSALAAFVAARRLTQRFWASLLAGAVYGFSAFELWHSLQGQSNLTVIALFPLMVYLLLRQWDGSLKAAWFVIWMALAMALQFYTFNEAFVDMTVAGAGAVVLGFLVAGREAWPKVARLAGLTAAAYAAAVVVAGPYLYYALRHDPKSLVRQQPTFSLSLPRLVLPSSDKLFGLTPLVRYSNHLGRYSVDDYVGLPLLLVLFALGIVAWRSRITRLLVIGFVLVIAIAVGPGLVVGTKDVFPLPWGRLWRLPLLRSAEPSRFIVFASLILALALALWLGASAKSRLAKAVRWALGLLAIAVAFADLPTFAQATSPVPASYVIPAGMRPADQLPAFLTEGLYRRYLTPGETVVVLTRRGNAGMLFQADADFYFRIAGGFINSSLTRQDALPVQVALLSHSTPSRVRGFRHYVTQAHIGAVIVEQSWEEPWMSVFGRIGLHATSAGGVTIYSTGVDETRFTQ